MAAAFDIEKADFLKRVSLGIRGYYDHLSNDVLVYQIEHLEQAASCTLTGPRARLLIPIEPGQSSGRCTLPDSM